MIDQIQEHWHVYFQDDYVPSDEVCQTLLGSYDCQMILDAIEICAANDEISRKPFENRLAYTKGILRNLKNSHQKQQWRGR